MGLILYFLIVPYAEVCMNFGIAIGVVVGLLPRMVRIPALVGLTIVSFSILSSINLDHHSLVNEEVFESFVPLMIAIASGFAAITILVMIPIRFILGKAISRIRQKISVRTQVVLAGGLVVLVAYSLITHPLVSIIGDLQKQRAQSAREEEQQQTQLNADLTHLAGKWYGFSEHGFNMGMKYNLSIDANGNVSIRRHRDEPVGTDVTVREITAYGPDVVQLTTNEERHFRPISYIVTRNESVKPVWPAPVIDSQFVTRLDDPDADNRADFFRMIESTASKDYLTAEKRLLERRRNPEISLDRYDYVYADDLAYNIYNKRLSDLYQFKEFENAYVTFVYGSIVYFSSGPGVDSCRHIHGLVYIRTEDKWVRIENIPPEWACDRESLEGENQDSVNSIVARAYGNLFAHELESKLRLATKERNHAEIMALTDFPLSITVGGYYSKDVRQWTEEQFTEALLTMDAERQSIFLSVRRDNQDETFRKFEARIPVVFDTKDPSGVVIGRFRDLTLFLTRTDREWRITHGEMTQ